MMPGPALEHHILDAVSVAFEFADDAGIERCSFWKPAELFDKELTPILLPCLAGKPIVEGIKPGPPGVKLLSKQLLQVKLEQFPRSNSI